MASHNKPATEDQITRLQISATEAVNKAVKEYTEDSLTEESAGKLLSEGSLPEEISTAIKNVMLAAQERVEKRRKYYTKYREPEVLDKQLKILCENIPELGENPTHTKTPTKTPNGAEGCFAIPNIWRPDPVLSGDYIHDLRTMLNLVGRNRGVIKFIREAALRHDNIRQTSRTENVMKKLSEDQNHPKILLIQAQFGINHRGFSTEESLREMEDTNQYGLGAFAVATMLLTHRERLKDNGDLWINCPGDEMKTDGNIATGAKEFDCAPDFVFTNENLGFGTGWKGRPSEQCGSATGFFPDGHLLIQVGSTLFRY